MGTRHGCTSPRALLKPLLAISKGAAPGVQDGSQHVLPNVIVEVPPLTAEALPVVLHPGLRHTTVPVLVMEVTRLKKAPCSGQKMLLSCLKDMVPLHIAMSSP